MDRTLIENRAQKVLTACNYDYENDIYIDSVLLCSFFGFTVMEDKNMAPGDDGCISVSENGKDKYILVNDDRSFESKRFIITHELSHYLLHYTGNESLFKHRENIKGKSSEENDADYLAACLLMPEKSFRKYYNKLKKKYDDYYIIVGELQKQFLTPKESIERRIKEVCR